MHWEGPSNARNDKYDALGALQDGGRPAPLPVRYRGGLVFGPLVELSCALDGSSDGRPNFSHDGFLARLSKVARLGLDDGVNILTEQENELVQLVLAP